MIRLVTILIAAAVLVIGGQWYFRSQKGTDREPVRVGVLHSFTGTMAISERSVADATLMAIEEINQQGGLLGRKIEPITADGHSDEPTFAMEAERLITAGRVSVIFGCWTSASRKGVKPVVEKYRHLLFYPVQYEGLEQSPNIIYTGATPNQQIIPAVKWCLDNLGKKFFLVGSDYVFPRTANAIMKEQITVLKGEILGEEYIPLGSSDVKGMIGKIVHSRPDVILNTINGDSNIAFFRELRAAGITPEQVRTMSFSIAEDELRGLDTKETAGDYAAWNYFQSVESKENLDFVKRFKKKYGQDRVTDDPMEAGYFGVHLWAQAVRDARSTDVRDVRRALANQSFPAPEGVVYLDGENQHTWKLVRIGKIRNDGQFDIVWSSEKPVRPVPYPTFRGISEWHAFLEDLYKGWGGRWANPGK